MDATPQPAILDNEAELKYTREVRNIQREISTEKKSQIASAKELYSYSKSTQVEVNRLLQENEVYNKTLQQGLITFKEQAKTGKLMGVAMSADKKHAELSQRLTMKLVREQLMLNRESIQLVKEEDRIRMAGENKWVNITKQCLTEITGLKINELDLTNRIGKSILDQGVESEALAYTLGAIVMMLKGAFDLFKKMDTAAWEFRKAMGMTRVESAGIRKDAEGMAIDYMAMGVTIDQLYKSYQSIGRAVGGVHNVTKEMARDVALMSAQLGIAENTSVDFMRNLAVVSRSTMESQQNMLGLAQSFASAAGVPLDQVMKDVGTKSATTLTLMSRMPTTLIKAATELRRMGTSMDDVAAAGAHILDFQTSMEDEMASSVLLGKNVSFQKARELTYARDLEGAAKETLKLAQQNGFAHKMDYFQQQAFAKASGYSVDQLLTMVQTSEQLAAIKRGTNVQAKAELASYEKMRHENEATLKARAKDSMYQIRTMANQQRIVQIQNKWNELLAKAEQFLLPVIDVLLKGVLIVVNWAAWFAVLGGRIIKFCGPLWEILGIAGKISLFFGEWLEPIGWVIMAFQALSGIFRGWSSTTGNWIQKFGGAILGMLEGVIPGFSYVEKLCGWIWSKVGGVAKALFMWTTPIGWAIMAFKSLFGHTSQVGGSVSKIWSAIKHVASAIWTVEKFLFKWFTPIGLIIQAFKGLKNLMPETFGAIGNLLSKVGSAVLKVGKFLFMWTTPIGWAIMAFKSLFGHTSQVGGSVSKIWSAIKHVASAIWTVEKFLFKWFTPIGLIIQAFKSLFGHTSKVGGALSKVWTVIKNVASAVWNVIKALSFILFPIKLVIGAIKMVWGIFKSITGSIKAIDHAIAGVVNAITHPFKMVKTLITGAVSGAVSGIKHAAGGIFHAITSPFRAAASAAKTLGKNMGSAIHKGLSSAKANILSVLKSPFSSVFGWFHDKYKTLQNAMSKKGSVEHKATAAYVPVAKITPNSNHISDDSMADARKDEEERINRQYTKKFLAGTLGQTTSDETYRKEAAVQDKIVELLERIAAKDPNIKMDGQLLSTTLARQTEFKGGYGVNKTN